MLSLNFTQRVNWNSIFKTREINENRKTYRINISNCYLKAQQHVIQISYQNNPPEDLS